MVKAGAAPREGFSLIELMVVIVIIGLGTALALPRLALGSYRVDAMAQQVRSTLQTSQRTSLTRQFDVIVSIDTLRSALRIAEDRDNSGTISAGEVRAWRATGVAEGNVFAVPPRGFRTATVRTSVVGSSLSQVDGMPSIVFHRDGSASTDAEIYVSNSSRGLAQYRLITLTRSTGRTDIYRLAGTGPAAAWQVVR